MSKELNNLYNQIKSGTYRTNLNVKLKANDTGYYKYIFNIYPIHGNSYAKKLLGYISEVKAQLD